MAEAPARTTAAPATRVGPPPPSTHHPPKGVVAVVAKVPHPGRSKTRLMKWLGPHGAATLAEALLQDVVTSLNQLEEDKCHKVLLYAPHTNEDLAHLQQILLQIGVVSTTTTRSDATDDDQRLPPLSDRSASKAWHLLPLPQSDDCTNPNLSIALTSSAQLLQQHYPHAPSLVWVGMDAPELPRSEVQAALNVPPGWAHLCPASDGGYGLLGVSTTTTTTQCCLPNQNDDHDVGADGTIHHQPQQTPTPSWFDGVLWSHPLTALSQLKALQRAGFDTVRLGQLIHDMDDESDVKALCQRLLQPQPQKEVPMAVDSYGCLDHMSSEAAALRMTDGGTSRTAQEDSSPPPCTHTRRALADLGLLVRDS